MGTNLGQGLVPNIDDYLFWFRGLSRACKVINRISFDKPKVGQGLVPSFNHHLLNMADTALILIDIQQGFDDPRWGRRNNPGAEKNAAILLNFFRENNLPLYHIQHLATEKESLLRPDKPGVEIKPIVAPKSGERVVNKSVNSAFIGTDLKEVLEKDGIKAIVFVGLTTDHCVSTTARMAGNYGFRVIVISDATATFERQFNGKHFSAKVMHEVALASLNNEFAEIMTTKQLLKLLS